jgi:16S rRNA (cytidine1402-2'-O)-methyltransferase
MSKGFRESSGTGVLHVVATPIGNLEDISARALDVLSRVELIAAEDTRQTLKLLRAFDVAPPELLALHDHNEKQAAARVLEHLKNGADAALVSDAGTPLLSDPGFTLVRSCFAEGVAVRPVPGPSAVMAALSVCPLPATDVRFAGFLPARSGARRERLQSLLAAGDPVVFFEAPHRLRDTLSELDELAAERRVFVAREMTKAYETYLCDVPSEIVRVMDQAEQWRGEVVCVLEGSTRRSAGDAEAARVMKILAGELPPARAAKVGAALLGLPKAALYDLVKG